MPSPFHPSVDAGGDRTSEPGGEFQSPALEKLVRVLSRLPGLGRKSATRIALHMIQNGGWFDACQETDGTLRRRINFCGPGGVKTGALVVESCGVCHDAGHSADVARAHQLNTGS